MRDSINDRGADAAHMSVSEPQGLHVSSSDSSSDDDYLPLFVRCCPRWLRRAEVQSEHAVLCIMFAALVSLGVVYFHDAVGCEYITAIYMIVQLVTTIGYGDINADASMTMYASEARVFVALYALVCIVIGAHALNMFMSWTVSIHTTIQRNHLRQFEACALGIQEDTKRSAFDESVTTLVIATLTFGSFIAMGTVFFATVERCTCSYGDAREMSHMNLTACPDSGWSFFSPTDTAVCEAAGGFIIHWPDAFYMSVITLTTIGFGDFSPKSRWGRVFGIVWMLGGVSSAGFFTSQLSRMFFERKTHMKLVSAGDIDKGLFDEIDASGDGVLTRAEYIQYCLVRNEMVAQEDFERINEKFNSMAAGKEVISWDGLCAAIRS